MDRKVLNGISATEFQQLVAAFIDGAEPNVMSFEALEEATNILVDQAVVETFDLTGVVQGDTITFQQPDAPVVVRDNEIIIGGLRLVIHLESATSARDD